MYKSVLLRRIILLVILALVVSLLLTVMAFTLAGKSAVFNVQVNGALEQTEALADLLSDSPYIIEDRKALDNLFGTNAITERNVFILERDGDTLYAPSSPTESDARYYSSVMEYVQTNMITGPYERRNIVLKGSYFIDQVLVLCEPFSCNGEDYWLVSVSSVSENNELILNYNNILLLSTLIAMITMLVPVYLVSRRIINPIRNVNSTAREYASGNFSVRADEEEKGEIGELAASFNYLANRLSKSISDLTIERNRLKDIFDVISEGIVVVDETVKPIFVNKALNTIFDKVQKKNLFTERLQLIPFSEVWDAFDECVLEPETKNLILEGPNYAYNVTIVPKYDIDNVTCIGATGFFRDFFEESKLEKTRQEYVANISHELRTPLQTLRGLIEPLADDIVKKEEDKKRYYGIILHETMRLSRLIDDMLELSKLQSGTLAFKTFPFDLNELLSEIQTKFTPVMRDADLTFKVEYHTGELPVVMGNPDRVEQILVILIDNAKKYTPAGGTITISTEYNEVVDKVFVSVVDTGQGIHEYDINHIFDRFFKADRARGKKGTGLGLAIAKELLSYMGEDITVESKYGEGAAFTFTLKHAVAETNW